MAAKHVINRIIGVRSPLSEYAALFQQGIRNALTSKAVENCLLLIHFE